MEYWSIFKAYLDAPQANANICWYDTGYLYVKGTKESVINKQQ